MNTCLKHSQMYDDYCKYCGDPAAYRSKEAEQRANYYGKSEAELEEAQQTLDNIKMNNVTRNWVINLHGSYTGDCSCMLGCQMLRFLNSRKDYEIRRSPRE